MNKWIAFVFDGNEVVCGSESLHNVNDIVRVKTYNIRVAPQTCFTFDKARVTYNVNGDEDIYHDFIEFLGNEEKRVFYVEAEFTKEYHDEN